MSQILITRPDLWTIKQLTAHLLLYRPVDHLLGRHLRTTLLSESPRARALSPALDTLSDTKIEEPRNKLITITIKRWSRFTYFTYLFFSFLSWPLNGWLSSGPWVVCFAVWVFVFNFYSDNGVPCGVTAAFIYLMLDINGGTEMTLPRKFPFLLLLLLYFAM